MSSGRLSMKFLTTIRGSCRQFQRKLCSEVGTVKTRKIHEGEAGILANSLALEGSRVKTSDLKMFHRLDPSGYYMSLTDSGEVIATIGGIRYNDSFGYIGFRHVAEEKQGQGFDKELLDVALEHLKERWLGIELQPEEVEQFQKLGFITAWHNGCFKADKTPFFPELGHNPSIQSIPDGPMGRVVEYDTEVFGVERRRFVMNWTKTDRQGTSLLVTENGNNMGYGVLRPLQEAKCHRIGPLYALNTAVAQVLTLALISAVPDETLYITAPLDNPSFIRLLTNDLRFEQINETVRMYTKTDHNIPTHKLFAIVDSNVG
ncbi:uncharacterized protein LOC117105062 [Anneissia japonica]|uniref:uncharacterized protein LOC117105062 n=1 Tax=Anneissia japonica TaxID=1529436 RepID=UPI0014254EE0|nr:uncharacterized protein LOC117105062 [Anneissia japonica]